MTIAIKMAGDWTLHILSAPFGSPSRKDAHGDWFSPTTDFAREYYGLPPVVYYHGYDESGRQSRTPHYIGKTTKFWIDHEGGWHEVELDPTKQHARLVRDAALKGQAAASPGTAEHLIRRSANGHLDHWPILEVSVFETTNGKRPANPRAVALPAIKAIYEEAGLSLPDDIEAPEADPQGASARGNATSHNDNHPNLETTSMTEEEMNALIEKRIAEREAAAKAAADAEALVQKRIADEVEAKTAAIKADMEKQVAAGRRLPFGGGNQAPAQTKFSDVAKYDNNDLADQAVMVTVLDAARRGGRSVNGVSASAIKALAIKAIEDTSVFGHRTRHALKAAGLDINPMSNAIKADELNQADLTSYGDEWVGQSFSDVMWMGIRESAKVAMKFPTVEIPQGSESIHIPLEATPPTFYNVAGASDLNATTGRPDATIPASKLGTDKKLVDTAKLGARTVWQTELEEDSLIPWLNELRRQMTEEAGVVLDHVCIDGDTVLTANTNINHIAGTPNAAAAYTTFNGLRKLALITNTANARDGGTAAFEDVVQTMKLLGTNGIAALDASKCSAIIDPLLNWKLLELLMATPNYNIVTVRADGVRVINVAGYDVIVTAAMHRAAANCQTNTAGKIDQTVTANNTKSGIVGVRWDQWRMAMKRPVTVKVSEYPEADSNQIVMTMRLKLHNRDTEGAAYTYNLTV